MNRTVSVGDRLTADEGVDALRESIREVLRNGRREIVLDLGQVTHIDSSGLAELLSSRTAMEASGRRLRLAGLMEDVLRITRLDRLFAIVEDERRLAA